MVLMCLPVVIPPEGRHEALEIVRIKFSDFRITVNYTLVTYTFIPNMTNLEYHARLFLLSQQYSLRTLSVLRSIDHISATFVEPFRPRQ